MPLGWGTRAATTEAHQTHGIFDQGALARMRLPPGSALTIVAFAPTPRRMRRPRGAHQNHKAQCPWRVAGGQLRVPPVIDGAVEDRRGEATRGAAQLDEIAGFRP